MGDLRVQPAVRFETLILIGGGEFSFGETREVDEYLVTRFRGASRTVAFLPTASGSAEYATHYGRYLSEVDSTVQTVNVPIYRGRDNRRQKSLAAIAEAGLVYVGGGVASRLLETFAGSPAEEALRVAAAAGTPVAAIGAAATSFGTAIWDGSGSMPGLGWLANTVVATGFDPSDDALLRRLMSLPDVTLGLGIPPGTALVIEGDGSTRVIGPGSIAAFRKR